MSKALFAHQEAAAALQIIKALTAKYKGAPPKGSEDFAHLIAAMRVMEGKGIPTTFEEELAHYKFEHPNMFVRKE